MLEDLGAYKEVDNIRASIISDPNVYRHISVKPIHDEEREFYNRERKPNKKIFSRLDHIMTRHGAELSDLFNVKSADDLFARIVESLNDSADQYRDAETGNLVFYNPNNNLTIIVRDKPADRRFSNPPPPPPFITTAYTLEGGRDMFENRKSRRAIH